MNSDAIEIPQPWLEDSLEQLGLRKRDRCLVLSCPTSAHVAAVSHLVGRAATIVVVEPDLSLAELASRGKHEDLEVLNCTPSGDERFGTFDALLACPLTTMGWSLTLWADLIDPDVQKMRRLKDDEQEQKAETTIAILREEVDEAARNTMWDPHAH